ncbi:hypothetical protein cje3_06215 [Campylobacter jejuni subsp. jejuni 110-21]|nr:hypothetical protein cje3_06215 [Campylobacter jejuni subsp. jejuni 110-21]
MLLKFLAYFSFKIFQDIIEHKINKEQVLSLKLVKISSACPSLNFTKTDKKHKLPKAKSRSKAKIISIG